MSWFWKNAEIMCTHGLNAGPLFFVLWMKYLSKCTYSKKPPLPWKSPDCAPVTTTAFLHVCSIIYGVILSKMMRKLAIKKMNQSVSSMELLLSNKIQLVIWQITVMSTNSTIGEAGCKFMECKCKKMKVHLILNRNKPLVKSQ